MDFSSLLFPFLCLFWLYFALCGYKHSYAHFCFSSGQSLSRVRLSATPWTVACQASLSITNSQSLLKLLSIESVMPSNHLIIYHPLLPPPSIFPSIKVFPNESVLPIVMPRVRVPKTERICPQQCKSIKGFYCQLEPGLPSHPAQ